MEFWERMTATPLLLTAVMLVLGVIVVNGWTDAPNAIATCVATRCLSPNAAIGMAAVCNFLGVCGMTAINNRVVVTVTSMVNFGEHTGLTVIVVLCAAMVAVVLWATLAWAFGIPTSESHALLAGLTGGAVALRGWDAIVWAQWQKVLGGLVLSVILGFGLAWSVGKLIIAVFRHTERMKAERFFKGAQIAGAAGMAFMHGAQDGQKCMGMLLLCTAAVQGDAVVVPPWLMVGCSAVMAAGTAMGGKKIIKSVGMDLVKTERYQGFAADVAAALALAFCSVWGLPVSTTHVKTTAVMGVGVAGRRSAVRFGVVREMVLAWILTFPGCAVLAFGVARWFLRIF